MLTVLAHFLFVSLFAGSFPLDWNGTWRTDTPYEVSIDLAKIDAQGENLQVFADGKGLKTFFLRDSGNSLSVFRFNVPAGTKSLSMGAGKNTVVETVDMDNIMTGGVWSSDKYAAVRNTPDGVLMESKDWETGTVTCTAKVPEGMAGKPVVFELDCRSVAKMTWASKIYMKQYDKSGKLLSEYVYDGRWTTHLRPPQKETPYRETGYLHPEAAKVSLVVNLFARKAEYDNYGLTLKTPEDALPKLLVTHLALRTAAKMPFPKYNDSFFGSGVSGNPDDRSLVLGQDRAFWYCTRSQASWGQAQPVRNESEAFYPFTDGTVELWLKPMAPLKGNEKVLFEAAHSYTKANTHNYPVLRVAYLPKSKSYSLTLADCKEKKFTGSGAATLPIGEWTHFAVTFVPGGDAVLYVGGKKVISVPLKGYAVPDYAKDKQINSQCPDQFIIGSSIAHASHSTENGRLHDNVKFFQGEADLLRVSTGVRYSSEFTPERSFTVDADTRALFDFNRSFDGVSGGGLTWIPGTINAPEDRIEHRLGSIQYYPAELQDIANPFKLLHPRVKEIPTEKEYAAADVTSRVSLNFKPGEKKTVNAPANAYTDFVEIANTGNSKLLYPAVLRDGDIDARSYGDIAESLDIPGVSDREKANRFFDFFLIATDYFMSHQIMFPLGSDKPLGVEYYGLDVLNSYCGFECGPLNNTAASMFSMGAGLPANLLGGYGHQFEQVFFDGKNHHYDLSAQKFFPAMDNETAAGLGESDTQEYIQRRVGASGSHFTRRGSRGIQITGTPYPEKFAVSLNPGERIRIYTVNEGQMNDLVRHTQNQMYKKIPFSEELSSTVHAESFASGPKGVFRIDRFFPEYGNAFILFDGKPASDNPAFVNVEPTSFCYSINTHYPIVAASYDAVLKNGKKAALQISTDGGATFRDFSSPATYAVRARKGYLLKVCAPIADVERFVASTELQVNSRIITGRLKPGDNPMTLKAQGGSTARVTWQYRTDGKPITFEGAVSFGALIGCEKDLALLEPSRGALKMKVNGVSSKAYAEGFKGLKASLKKGVLSINATDSNPHFGWVTVHDGNETKTLTVLVCDGARLASVGKVLTQKGEKAEAQFEKVNAGKYLVFSLQRQPVDLKFIHNSSAKVKLGTAPAAPGCYCINNSCDYYKDVMGPDGGKGVWRWDTPLGKNYSYPYQEKLLFNTEATDKIEFTFDSREEFLEISHVLLIPAPERLFECEITKFLFGRNMRPWIIDNK